MNDIDGQTTAVLTEANYNMPRPTTTSSENDQSSVVNDQQPKEVEDTTAKMIPPGCYAEEIPKRVVRRLVI